MLHAKTATIDWRRFVHDELDATMLGRELAFDLRLKERAAPFWEYWL